MENRLMIFIVRLWHMVLLRQHFLHIFFLHLMGCTLCIQTFGQFKPVRSYKWRTWIVCHLENECLLWIVISIPSSRCIVYKPPTSTIRSKSNRFNCADCLSPEQCERCEQWNWYHTWNMNVFVSSISFAFSIS